MVSLARRLEAAHATPDDPGFDPLTRREQEVADWTPTNPAPHDEAVEAYSSCEEVELLLNGKSLGVQSLPQDASPRAWKVPFEPGSLKAIGKNRGQVVATCELHTAGKPARVFLRSDGLELSAEWDSVACIRAAIVDDKGVIIPDAHELVTFNVSDGGTLVAVDSGDNSSHESFRASARRACHGTCLAVVRAARPSGKITVTASAPGLAAGTVTLTIHN